MTTRTPTTRSPRRLLAGILLPLLVLTVSSCSATRAFRSAEDEERRQHWDLAVLAYEKAVELDPGSYRYKLALTRARQQSAFLHYERGKLYRTSGNLDLAVVEFEQALAVNPTLATAQQELRKARVDLEARKAESEGGTPVERAKAKVRGARAAGPMLNPASTKPIDLIFPTETNIKKIYNFLASAAGINIIFDPQLKDDKFSLDLRGVAFQKALETVLRQAGHFYKVLDEKTIIVAQDNNQNRKEYEDLVIRTFFLSNGDVKDVSNMIRSILDLRRLGTIQALNAIVIRDTADKVAVAERIIEINDKAKSEVLIDVELVVLSTTKALELGTKLSSYSTTASLAAPAGSTSGSTVSLPWNQIWKLGIGNFNFTIPSVTFNFIKNNTDAETIAKPQLRIAEGEKAQLIIGQKVPIPVTTISTQTAVGSTGIVPVTSFQYQDIGIKIDIEPRVHHNKEVTLKMTIEASTDDGKITSPSGDQTIIGTRTITSTIRLKDGETNVLAGLIRKDTKRGKSSVPFLGDLPIIGALFSDTSDEVKGTDLLMTLTPHIIRSPSITEDDLVPVWVGTENNISFSGLSTRLESPTAPGSPFDGGVEPTRPAGPAAVTPQPMRLSPTSGTTMPLPTMPVPAPSRPGVVPRASVTPSPAVQEDAKAAGSDLSLMLEPSSAGVASGGTSSLAVTASGGTEDLNALEIVVEWDPALTDVVSIAPGPWSGTLPPGSVRFEADRVPGRARLQWNRSGAGIGLPGGVLATLSVKGVGEGRAVFKVASGSGLGRSGVVRPLAAPAAIRVGEMAP